MKLEWIPSISDITLLLASPYLVLALLVDPDFSRSVERVEVRIVFAPLLHLIIVRLRVARMFSSVCALIVALLLQLLSSFFGKVDPPLLDFRVVVIVVAFPTDRTRRRILRILRLAFLCSLSRFDGCLPPIVLALADEQRAQLFEVDGFGSIE